MTEQEKYDQIDRYLRRELPATELENFERRMEADEEFSIEVALHREIAESIGGEKSAAFRQTLQTTNDNWKQTEDEETLALIRKLQLSRVLAIAATVALLIIAGFYFSNNSTTNGTTDLFALHYDAYPMMLNERTGTNQSTTLKDAVKSYTNKNYGEAAMLFGQLSLEEKDNTSFQFYQAMSFLSTNETSKAVELLEPLTESDDHPFAEQAQWYTGLSYLHLEDKARAEFYLSAIKKGAYKYDEAKAILEKMR